MDERHYHSPRLDVLGSVRELTEVQIEKNTGRRSSIPLATPLDSLERVRALAERTAWGFRFAARRLTAPARPLPQFLIIGAMRSGTKTLYSQLLRHSKVRPSLRYEVHYFDCHADKGASWYQAFFPLQWSIPDGGITGEKSPYYLFHPRAPRRVAEVLGPEVRLIAILRDPVTRAFSHYMKEVRMGRETLSFPAALEAEEGRLFGERERMMEDLTYNSFAHRHHSYRTRGIYVDQLQSWFAEFDRDNVLVLKAESLFRAPEPTVNRLLEFLGLPWEDLGPVPHRNKKPQKSRERETMTDETRASLQSFFEPHNLRLCELMGWEKAW